VDGAWIFGGRGGGEAVKRGRLIAIEGIDGAGKTTQAQMLADHLRSLGHTVVITKEPTDGPYGRKIRALSSAGESLSPDEALAYFIADRREHVRDLIAPRLQAGDVVITDRYFLSNVAYQGAEGLSPEDVLQQNEALFPLPDAVLLLGVSPEEGLRRVTARGGELNQAYERIDFLLRAAQIFAALERPYIHRIEGEASPEAVHELIKDALADLLDSN
jgi:dTMP kinase